MFDAETEKVNDAEDELTPFYKEAFQCFDWNNSGRISTSVSSMALLILYLTSQNIAEISTIVSTCSIKLGIW